MKPKMPDKMQILYERLSLYLYFNCLLCINVKTSSALKKTAGEPVKTSGPARRLESEVKMRTSAEAYLRGSADVRLFCDRGLPFKIYCCMCLRGCCDVVVSGSF